MLAKIERKLGRLKSEAPKALKNALNQTARHAHMRGMQSLYMYCRCMKGLIFVAI